MTFSPSRRQRPAAGPATALEGKIVSQFKSPSPFGFLEGIGEEQMGAPFRLRSVVVDGFVEEARSAGQVQRGGTWRGYSHSHPCRGGEDGVGPAVEPEVQCVEPPAHEPIDRLCGHRRNHTQKRRHEPERDTPNESLWHT